LVYGVYPLLARRADNTDEILDGAIHAAVNSGLIKRGDTVIITAGISVNMPGSTDLMKVETIPEIIAQGTGVLDCTVIGKVCRVTFPITLSAEDIDPGEILVVESSDRALIPLVQRAAGLITQEGGPGCHAHTMAVELGVPAIIGATGSLAHLENGMLITIDTAAGVIYAGRHDA
jgi:pyruvate kinase